MNKFTALAATVVIADLGWHVFQELRKDKELHAKRHYIEECREVLRKKRAQLWQTFVTSAHAGCTTTMSNGHTVKITYSGGVGGVGGSYYAGGSGGGGGGYSTGGTSSSGGNGNGS